jgi:hypothetical protein
MLISGDSYRTVMDAYPRLSHGALSRHKTNHLAPAVLDRLARSAELSADRVVSWVAGLVESAAFEYARCRQDGDRINAVRFLTEARHGAELLARVGGHLDSTVNVSVDARNQVAVLASMSEDELRSLVAAAEGRELDAGRQLASVVDPAPAEALTGLT